MSGRGAAGAGSVGFQKTINKGESRERVKRTGDVRTDGGGLVDCRSEGGKVEGEVVFTCLLSPNMLHTISLEYGCSST